uniref:Myb/SANT-like DNA-binding domain-containing protein n=1 Tax=Chelonoidis abingdonii TaxID=106734 RepID=A0A8C0GCE7_CHEAB
SECGPGKHWTVNEVRALIHIWSDKNIQQQLEVTVRNKRIFEQVATRLQKFGIERDWKQCRTKYKNLKHEYKNIKNAQDSGNTSKSMKFFNELDAILGHNTGQQSKDNTAYVFMVTLLMKWGGKKKNDFDTTKDLHDFIMFVVIPFDIFKMNV